MYKSFALIAFSALTIIFSACSGNDTKSADSTTDTIKPVNVVIPPSTNPVNPEVTGTTQITPTTGNQVVINPSPTTTTTTTTTSTSAASGINPAHGQPGHRCDIPVGSPLNSKPTTSTVPPQITTVNPTTVNPTTVNPTLNPISVKQPTITPTVTTAPGMNPAHGQPGHRCDIPVGSPLNAAKTEPAKPAPVSAITSPKQ